MIDHRTTDPREAATILRVLHGPIAAITVARTREESASKLATREFWQAVLDECFARNHCRNCNDQLDDNALAEGLDFCSLECEDDWSGEALDDDAANMAGDR